MSSPAKRRDTDVMKLMMSPDFQVSLVDDDAARIHVRFEGPKGTLYEGGIFKVLVTLPAAYPYKSPSIGFETKIYHPNIDERSGSVCLDVINQTWSPMFDLTNIFSVFLPQLLAYPNESDPLNGEAAGLKIQDEKKYEARVREYIKLYASEEVVFSDSDDSQTDDDAELSEMDDQDLDMDL